MYRATQLTRANATRRRNAIAEAARQQIIDGGFRSATVKTVARRAGCSAGLIYQYFPNAEELLKGAFAHVGQHELAIFRDALHRDPDIRTALATAIDTAVRRALGGPKQADALLFEALPQQVEEERLVFRRRWAETIAHRLDQAIADGQIPDQPTPVVGTAVIGAVVENLLPRLHATTPAEPEQPVEAFITALQLLCQRLVGVPATLEEQHDGRLS